MLQSTEERESRVADYLDDKLQTLADLESLDALLLSVRNQQSLLKRQLDDAEKDLSEARQAATEHDRSLTQQKTKFQRSQVEIDKRLRVITQSDASDDAVQKFESSMERLRRLDVANGYVNLLQQAEDVSQACSDALGKDDTAALSTYQQLRGLTLRLQTLQEAADGAAPHLLDYMNGKADALRQTIQDAFTKEFESVLAKCKWPSVEATMTDDIYDQFSKVFRKLLDLQLPELLASQSQSQKRPTHRNPETLLPLKVMAHALELGFRYHFEGDKPTNRLDRPEYFLSHILERLLPKYSDFYGDNVQPLLLQYFGTTSLIDNPVYIDASSALITSLLPMVRSKVFSILPDCRQQPQLLSHLIHELMDFDAKLRDDWGFDLDMNGEKWRGITWDVLSTDHWFATWLEIEKNFALARYEEIVNAPESFSIDFDSVAAAQTKPTKAAIRVNDLIETTTDHYRNLVSFSQKVRFLIDIQTALFDRFHGRLADNLRLYLSRTSTLTRASKEEQISLQGLAGLETLCKTYGSAEYLETSMKDWSDDVFFLELWAELQGRASGTQTGNIGNMTLSQVAEKTSTTINTNEDNDFSLGSIFDEPAVSYQRLRTRCEGIMIELLQNSIRQNLNGYVKINPWATMATDSGASSSPSAELDPLLSSITSLLAFLIKALSQLVLQRITRQACTTLDGYLLDRVLLVHSFSTAGTIQFNTDLQAIRTVLARYVGDALATSGLAKSAEATKLLSVPIKGSPGDDTMEVLETAGQETAEKQWGLWEVERKLIKSSGEEARHFMEEFGLEKLSLIEARKVLARKIELGS